MSSLKGKQKHKNKTMPQNLELKIKLESFSEIKKRLKKIGADFKATLNQKDIY